MEIKISDDGRGIDFEEVRKKAIDLGLLDEAAAKEANTAEEAVLNDIIFRPGFSTAREISMHAGRGIGLNLVRDRVLKIGGTVEVHTQKGYGAEFVIRF
ncbi:hypothetical protein AGMMS50212_00420 [Spirochaetia bacterium]|nr:hypothetical protein AGMMS50212_00420 [Spirochaetia bacterium]